MTGEIERSDILALTHVLGHSQTGLFGRAAIKDLTGAKRPTFLADFEKRIYRNGRTTSEAAAMAFVRASKEFWPITTLPAASAANVPVFASQGLILEPEKTNLVPNPTGSGAVLGTIGSGGAAPTNWFIDTATNASCDIIDRGKEGGIPYVRVRLYRSGGSPSQRYPSFNAVGATSGTTVATPAGNYIGGQAWCRVVSAKAPATATPRLALLSNGSIDSNSASQLAAAMDNRGWQRMAAAKSASGTASRLYLGLDLGSGNDAADFDVTIDFALASLTDMGAFAVTYADLTSIFDNSTAKREAAVVTMDVPNGTYDRYVVKGAASAAPFTPAWTDDVVISGGAGDVLATPTFPTAYARMLYFDAGLSADEKNAIADYYDPVVYGSNLPYATYAIGGETFTPQNVLKQHSILKAANRTNLYRFELRKGEYPASIDAGGTKDRCELSGQTQWVHGNKYWVAFDVMFVKVPAQFTNTYFIICQLHDSADAGELGPPPCFAVGVDLQNRLYIDINSSTVNPFVSYNDLVSETLWTAPAAIEQDRLYRLVIAAKEGYTGTGSLEAWLDGVKIVNVANKAIGYNNLLGSYIKFGLYRGAGVNTTVASEVSNFALSTSSLASRITDPLAIA
jgi:hypothetical protein